jgi:hypothetical protein
MTWTKYILRKRWMVRHMGNGRWGISHHNYLAWFNKRIIKIIGRLMLSHMKNTLHGLKMFLNLASM